jgi:hypothetical protein
MPESTLMPGSTFMPGRIGTLMLVVALGLVTAGCSEQAPKAADAPADRAPASQPASQAAAQPAQAGTYEGFIDEVSCQIVRGWAWDPSKPDAPLTIELYDGSRLLKTLAADQLRPDLADGGKGNGKHMFRETTPKEFVDGKPHAIRAVIKGTAYQLKPSAGVSDTLTCAPSGT